MAKPWISTLKQANFSTEIWPKIVLEVELAFTLALLVQHRLEKKVSQAEEVAKKGIGPLKKWRKSLGCNENLPWNEMAYPLWINRDNQSLQDYQKTVAERLGKDIEEAELGNKEGPLKAALDVFRDIRNELRESVQYGRISGESYRDHLQNYYTPMNTFLSIGPPLRRVKELKALVETGVVKLLPASPIVALHVEKKKFTYFMPSIPDEYGETDVLIEARMPEGNVGRSADLLLQNLLKQGLITLHKFLVTSTDSGAINVDPQTFRVKTKRSRSIGMFAYGISLEGLQWGTAATIRPFVNSVIIHDADTIASQIEKDLYE